MSRQRVYQYNNLISRQIITGHIPTVRNRTADNPTVKNTTGHNTRNWKERENTTQ